MTYYSRAQHDTERSSRDLADARTLVIRFLADLRDDPIGHDILDARELPAPRPMMVEAFERLIENEPRFRIRDQLKLVGVLLSQFQDGVGPRLQVQAASIPFEAPEPPEPDIMAIRRIERALAAVEPDRVMFVRLFDLASERARSKMRRTTSARSWQTGGRSGDRAGMAR